MDRQLHRRVSTHYRRFGLSGSESAHDVLQHAARSFNLNLPRLLGYVIAHEVGHLLLPERVHTVAGLMRANLDVRQFDRRLLYFTREQAAAMRATADHMNRCFSRGASLGPANGSDLPASASSAKEPIAAVGLESGHDNSPRHLELLQDFSRSRIDSPHIAFITFPGAVPQLAVNPGDAGDEPVRLDGANDRTCLGIDLMNLAVPI